HPAGQQGALDGVGRLAGHHHAGDVAGQEAEVVALRLGQLVPAGPGRPGAPGPAGEGELAHVPRRQVGRRPQPVAVLDQGGPPPPPPGPGPPPAPRPGPPARSRRSQRPPPPPPQASFPSRPCPALTPVSPPRRRSAITWSASSVWKP